MLYKGKTLTPRAKPRPRLKPSESSGASTRRDPWRRTTTSSTSRIGRRPLQVKRAASSVTSGRRLLTPTCYYRTTTGTCSSTRNNSRRLERGTPRTRSGVQGSGARRPVVVVRQVVRRLRQRARRRHLCAPRLCPCLWPEAFALTPLFAQDGDNGSGGWTDRANVIEGDWEHYCGENLSLIHISEPTRPY